MKSKTSFFNKGIFWKNVTLYWPIWAIYMITLFFLIPGRLWLESNSWGYSKQLQEPQIINILENCVFMTGHTVIIAIMALCTGIALFSYLFQAKTANMIHSLPVDRNQLFGTNVLSGLAFLIVPQIVTFIVAVLYCLSRGISHLEYLVVWLFLCMVIAFIAYSIVTICAFLTGQLITMIGFVVLVNIFSFVVSGLLDWIYNIFAFGLNGSIIPDELVALCSPLNASAWLQIRSMYQIEPISQNEIYMGMEISGKGVMLVYSIIAVALYVIAWLLYKKRHIEHAGDLLTVPFLKPVFRWGVGFCMAFSIAPMGYAILWEIERELPLPIFVVLFVICGMMGYWIADMLLKKNFKVFKKAYFKQWGLFSVCLVAGCIGVYMSTTVYETAIPSKEKVAYAKMDYGYFCKFEKEELDKVFAVHEAIIANKDLFEEMSHTYNYSNGYDYVTIYYYDENGSLLTSRGYRLPYNEEGIAIFQKIWEYEKEADKLLAHLFMDEYENITTFGGGSVEYPHEYIEEEDSIVYQGEEFDSNAAKVLYEAVIADAKAGTLYRYNSYWRYEELERKEIERDGLVITETVEVQTQSIDYDRESTLWLSYKWPNAEKKNEKTESVSSLINGYYDYEEPIYDESYWEGEERWSDSNINFGSDCVNIVNALVELGLIPSADVIP